MMTMQDEATGRRDAVRVALCVVVSLVVHGVLAWALWVGLQGLNDGAQGVKRKRATQLRVKIVTEELEVEKPKPFAKTDPDQKEEMPREADYVGARNARESAAEYTPARRSDAPAPSQNGDECDEIVTFDQDAQRGDLMHEDKNEQRTPPMAMGVPLPQPPQPATPSSEADQSEPPTEGAASVQHPPQDDEGDVRIQQSADNREQASSPPAPESLPTPPMPPEPMGVPMPVYDPSLADHMQPKHPGFRTRERRTRSTGRFVIGRRASLNVASTPQGRYEQEIYRRIAYFWYIACDDHRGDIIPGSVVISLRINTRGQLANMDLVKRTGASMSQQAFTFGAIRRATLPPMPPAVRQEIKGDLLELIFRFNFD